MKYTNEGLVRQCVAGARFPPPYIGGFPNLFRDAPREIYINGRELSINTIEQIIAIGKDGFIEIVGKKINQDCPSEKLFSRCEELYSYWKEHSFFERNTNGNEKV